MEGGRGFCSIMLTGIIFLFKVSKMKLGTLLKWYCIFVGGLRFFFKNLRL